MATLGTKRAFASERLKERNPADGRPPSPSVGFAFDHASTIMRRGHAPARLLKIDDRHLAGEP
jgi:hypothetical protein